MTLKLTMAPLKEGSRGLVRLAPKDMENAGFSPGQTIALSRARQCFGRAAPGHVSEGHVELDATSAANCGAQPGEAVDIAAAELGPLDAVHLRLKEAIPAGPNDLLDALFDMALADGDTLPVALPRAGVIEVDVARALPHGAGLVGDQTAIVIETPNRQGHDYDGIAGLTPQIARVHEMVATPLARPDLFSRLGLSAPRGVLFTGPPGSGKTLLARTVAAKTKATFFQIDGAEILSKHYGESEAALRRVFAAANKAEPAIIFIDEIDALAPRRADLSGEKQVERRVVAQLLTLMDGLKARGRVVVMAATNQPDALDPALRRPGRFDREIAFAPPSEADREAILRLHLADTPLEADVDLAAIARQATGYVGADLAALAREAGMAALARSVAAAGSAEVIDAESLAVTKDDLNTALSQMAPSLLRGTAPSASTLAWEDIGGLEQAKAALQRAVEWPRTHADAFASLSLRPPRGILLTGPPGTGKTLLARALAGAEALNFIAVRPPDLLSQFLGQAERAVSSLFETARFTAPSLLFFDEIDALAPRRGGADAVFDRIVAQMLVELDGISDSSGVTVLAATNRASSLDPALLRPGRFDQVIDIPLPDLATRTAILEVHFAGRPLADGVSLSALAATTAGASGADLAHLAERASWHALERAVAESCAPVIGRHDLDAARADLAGRSAAVARDFIAGDVNNDR